MTRIEPEPRAVDRRALWLLALLVVTLAGGAAARHLAPTRTSGGAFPGPLAFAASSAGPVSFSGRLDRGSILRGGDGLARMELVLRAAPAEGVPEKRPTDLVVVLDRSGSMQGEPLVHARASVRELIGQLGARDRFALISYASDAGVVLPLGALDEAGRSSAHAAIASIRAGGGTNMALGLDRGLDLATRRAAPGRSLRVVLISDGHANEGDHSPEGLRARAARVVPSEGVLSTVGVGLGFDEALMARLADAGTGNFHYVRHAEDLGSVFAGEFASARETVARALAVEVEPAAGVEVVDAAGYPLERDGRVVRLRPGALHGGQERRLWLTLRATPDAGRTLQPLGRFAIVYRDARDGAATRLEFASNPSVAVVADAAAYRASLDDEVLEQGLLTETMNALRERVAGDVARGDRKAAFAAIESYAEEGRAFYRLRGVPEKDAPALQEAEQLRGELRRAFRPAAAPAERNALGKKLKEEGRDGRRVGAKDHPTAP